MKIRSPFSRRDPVPGHSGTARSGSASTGPATVQEAIEQFENSTFPSKWSNIKKADLINDIKRTIADPFQIHQGFTPFCGPISIMFELVRRDPIKYVQLNRQLFEKGQCITDGKIIKAHKKFLESTKPDSLSVADWVFAGALRDSKNLFFRIKSSGGADDPKGIAGATGVPAMVGWTRHVLGFKKVKYKSTLLYGDIKSLEKANEAIKQGGVAFPLINANLLTGKPAVWGGAKIPNHWVVFLGNLEVKKGKSADAVKFDLYSWGGTHHVSESKKTIRQYYQGVVIGER